MIVSFILMTLQLILFGVSCYFVGQQKVYKDILKQQSEKVKQKIEEVETILAKNNRN